MYDRIDIKDFRSLQNQSIILGSNITVISGRNSTGKSTILGMLGNSGELKKVLQLHTGEPNSDQNFPKYLKDPKNLIIQVLIDFQYI